MPMGTRADWERMGGTVEGDTLVFPRSCGFKIPSDDNWKERWMDANGVTTVRYKMTDDQMFSPRYFKADGSEVTKENQIPWETLKKHPDVQGRA